MTFAQKSLLIWQSATGLFLLFPALYGILVFSQLVFELSLELDEMLVRLSLISGLVIGCLVWVWNVMSLFSGDYCLEKLHRLWWWNLVINAIYATVFIISGVFLISSGVLAFSLVEIVYSIGVVAIGLYPVIILTIFIFLLPSR